MGGGLVFGAKVPDLTRCPSGSGLNRGDAISRE